MHLYYTQGDCEYVKSWPRSETELIGGIQFWWKKTRIRRGQSNSWDQFGSRSERSRQGSKDLEAEDMVETGLVIRNQNTVLRNLSGWQVSQDWNQLLENLSRSQGCQISRLSDFFQICYLLLPSPQFSWRMGCYGAQGSSLSSLSCPQRGGSLSCPV